MDKMPESALPYIIGWVVMVTILFGILLPFVVNVPVLPVFLYKAVIGIPASAGISSDGPVQPENANPEGILVWYDFEDDLARTRRVVDRSLNGNTAFVHGLFIGPAPGRVGNQSLSLSGSGLVFTSANPAAGMRNVSFSLWFRAGDTVNNYNLASALTTGDPRTGWVIGTRSFELRDDAGRPVHTIRFARYPVPPDTWAHKVVVYNGSRVREYINGQLVADLPATGAPLGPGTGLNLGNWQPFAMNFAGQIDDFRIYDRALAGENVTRLYLQERE